ncbi:MAG: ATPase V [Treponema sp.]|nr:ATPase V [Treponema sp.]
MDYFFIGDSELVTAFRFIGVEGLAVSDSSQAVAVFRKITEGWDETGGLVLPDSLPGMETCRVLLMTEEVADWLGNYMIQWQINGKYPLLVEIPGIAGKLKGRKTLVESIREAIGIHV